MVKKDRRMSYLIIAGVTLFLVFSILINLDPPQVKTKKITLYFSDNQAQNLKSEMRQISIKHLYKNVVQELIKGPNSNKLVKTVPEGTELIDLKLEDNILVLNFNSKFRKNHWGGSTGEIITVYSIVNTLSQFSEVDQVLFLLEGKRVESLAGHVSLKEPIAPNSKLIID